VALFALSCSPWTSIITTTNQIVAKLTSTSNQIVARLTSTSNQIVASLHDLVEIENPVHMNCKEPILTNTVFISQKKKKTQNDIVSHVCASVLVYLRYDEEYISPKLR
jgi:hypothetical protein